MSGTNGTVALVHSTTLQYTYVFDGIPQVLDHVLVTARVSNSAFSYQVVHVNSEDHDQTSDRDPQVVRFKP